MELARQWERYIPKTLIIYVSVQWVPQVILMCKKPKPVVILVV